MKLNTLIATSTALMLAVVAIGSPAHAGGFFNSHRFAKVSPFEGQLIFCAGQNPPVSSKTLPNGVIKNKFINIGNVWRTGNTLVDGVEENVVFETLFPDAPPEIRIKGKVDVANFDGRWRFRQSLDVVAGVGTGIGLGFGDLRGKLMVFETGIPIMIDDSPCDVPFAVPLAGKVISFRWFW